MIEGLRVSPWLHEVNRRFPKSIDHLLDCNKCKEMNERTIRQAMGCGWEPRSDLVQIRTWSPSNLEDNVGWSVGIDSKHPDPQVCPGYTSHLPEVVEIARARMHWKEGGGLRDFCDDNPTEMLRHGVEIFEGANNELQRWVLNHPEKK